MAKTYNPKDFTWGYEVEWGDITRSLEVPQHLGKWEHAETDIVNLHGEYAGIACDPLGLEPPVGGEVNMRPTATYQEQVDRIMELHDFFVEAGDQPSASVVNHGHLHVHVPGLTDDIDALKRLIKYIKANQQVTVDVLYGFKPNPAMKKCKGATNYLKLDGGRLMPDYMSDNIINLATDFDHFIKLHAAGKDGVSMGRPFRYAINTYCLKHTGTIEFRCLRSSTDRQEIEDSFRFAEMFIDAALNDGPSVVQIMNQNEFKFPPFIWNMNDYNSWVETKYDKSRGEKVREYIAVA